MDGVSMLYSTAEAKAEEQRKAAEDKARQEAAELKRLSGIDLSVAANLALSGMIAALVSQYYPEVPLVLMILSV
jgi:hypothetical protein